jgi:hypothetical protein
MATGNVLGALFAARGDAYTAPIFGMVSPEERPRVRVTPSLNDEAGLK